VSSLILIKTMYCLEHLSQICSGFVVRSPRLQLAIQAEVPAAILEPWLEAHGLLIATVMGDKSIWG
jgi:hypothetical protein